MNHRHGQNGDKPQVGCALVAAFSLLLLVYVGAFGAASAGAFKPAPPARLVVARGKLDGVLPSGLRGCRQRDAFSCALPGDNLRKVKSQFRA